eukprot:m.238661 g.238661  ORF g.238661 m.238661 type:complete len:133 (-) comp16060_c0_seq27:369-767(-)
MCVQVVLLPRAKQCEEWLKFWEQNSNTTTNNNEYEKKECNAEQNEIGLLSLPMEVLECIIHRFDDVHTCLALGATCRKLRDVCFSPGLWQRMCYLRFDRDRVNTYSRNMENNWIRIARHLQRYGFQRVFFWC